MAFQRKEDGNTYINRFQRENYDRITILVKKGEKERYRDVAASMGVSLSEFFIMCAEERLKK